MPEGSILVRPMWGHLPTFLIGLIVATYWLRVMRLARKIRRRESRSAHVIPPGRRGIVTRVIWFPVVILWIAIPLSGPFIDYSFWLLRPLYDSIVIEFVGLGVAVVAFIFTLICWKKMGTSWRMGVDPAEKTVLITTGPYSRIRHPIYALSSLLMIATAAAVPAPLLLLIAALHLILLQFEARREERYLSEVHGGNYLGYINRTGRFFPRIA